MKKLKQLFSLKDKTAIITGGFGHLGSAITETLLEQGAKVIITCTKEEFKKHSGLKNISTAVINFSDKDSIINFFNSIKSADILINCAYSWVRDDFDSEVDSNLSAIFLCSKLFFEKCKGKGVIINIGSMYGVVSPDFRIYERENLATTPGYAAVKGGVIQLTRYLAGRWAKHGMRVNSISPGPFPKKNVVKNKKFIKSLQGKTMLGRIGQPEDLKGVVALLASDASSYITGQNFIIDGGWTAW